LGTAKDEEGNINLILKLKPAGAKGRKGCKGSAIGDYLVRSAKVISVAEACWMFGHEYSASEIYQYFMNARRLSTRRPHAWTNAQRRDAHLQHGAVTGRWGLDKGMVVGEVAWKGKVSVVMWRFGHPSWPLAATQYTVT